MLLEVGMCGSISKTITESDVCSFAGISGDYNPIHMNEEVAKKSYFKQRVAHGLLVGSLISAVIGTRMPGEGTVYLEQDLKFKLPVFIGDTCTAHVEVAELIKPEKGIYRLKTWITNQRDEIVTDGFAVVKY